jgi:serine/threonine-protein kinase RsbW
VKEIGVKENSDQFQITAKPQNAAIVRDRVKKAASFFGFSTVDLDDIEIAVGEAATNAILYGSPSETSRIVITTWFNKTENAFHIEVRDEGHGFDPNIIRNDEDTDSLGGRGIRLMRVLMDRVLLHYDGHGMSVRLTKGLSAP